MAVSSEVIMKMKNTDEIKWCQSIFGDELSKGQGEVAEDLMLDVY